MNSTRSPWFAAALPRLLARQDLDAQTVRDAVGDLMSGNADEVEAATFLVALRMKGETAAELAAAASVLRSTMLRLDAKGMPALDTCGTGGDDSGSFNISTAVAFVVAGAGVRVVKHGNRAVSSKSGSADVLAELGVPIDAGPAWAQRCLDEIGFAFCFAPRFHPAMANVGKLRKRLGVRTMFNLVGPLSNPAGAPYQLLGVGQEELLDPLAGALAELGVRQAVLVNGCDGLDEVSLAAPTRVRWVRDGEVELSEWQPADFGLDAVSAAEIRADGPADSARIIREVLAGTDGGARRIVLANAAAALLVAEKVATLEEGVEAARGAIDSGAAANVLASLTAGRTTR